MAHGEHSTSKAQRREARRRPPSDRALTLGEILSIQRDLAQQLAELHAHGGVHGTVSEHCILLDERGRPTLAPPAEPPAHPSPEQQRGEAPAPRSDVYALGATVLALLEPVERTPEPVARMLETMTREEPAERYKSMEDVLTALEACELMLGEPSRSRRNVLPLVIALLAVIMLGLALAVLSLDTPPPRSQPPADHAALKDLTENVSRSPRKVP
jgi:hypothetical protein